MSAGPAAAAAAPPPLLDERTAKELLAVALEAAAADEARVRIEERWAARVRHGGGASAAAEQRRAAVAITCAFGNRHATVTTPDLSREGLERAVARAEAMAKASSPDPGWVPEGPPAEITPVPAAWDEEVARPQPALGLAAEALADARRRELAATFEAVEEAAVLCVGSRRGLYGFHRGTLCRFTTLVRGAEGGAGWAGAVSVRRRDLDGMAAHRRAAELAGKAARPAALSPGAYPAVLSADAAAALLVALLPALDQRAADEGRSPLSRRGTGARLFGDLTLRSDPADALVPGAPFDGLGQARKKALWIERGVVRQLYGAPAAAARGRRQGVAAPDSLVLQGGAAAPSEAALLQDLRRGVYLTRLTDVQVLDPVTLRIAAYAPAGAFLVEDGKITGALAGLCVEQTLPELLAGAERATAPVRSAAVALRLACPALRLKALRCAATP